MVVTIPTYHIVSKMAPPPLGALKLGTIIDNLEELNTLNAGKEPDLDDSRLTRFSEEEFEITREQVLKGTGGIGIKVFDVPVGIDMSGGGETSVNDTYKFKKLDTVFFSPDSDDYQKAISAPRLHKYLKYSGYKPVYMITGMKIGHNPEVTLERGTQVNGTFSIGISEGTTKIGLNNDASKSNNIVQGSKSSPDSILFGIRVRKLVYTKRYYIAGQREWHDDRYNHGAELVGVDRHADQVLNDTPQYDVKELDIDEEVEGRTMEQKNNPLEGSILLVI